MTTQQFTVLHSTPLDDEDAPPARAGVLAIGDDLRIEVVAAEPDFEETLELAAEMANASDNFLIRSSVPGQMTRVVHKRAVPRDAAGAREALFEMLREKYGFELTPA